MARISEEQKNSVARYATNKGANLQAAEYCQTFAEVDAVYKCTLIIKQNRWHYLKALFEAPHNVKSNLEQQQKMVAYYGKGREVCQSARQLFPSVSLVQDTKNEILDLCLDELKNTGFGKKRTKKILTALRSTLTDEEEEFEHSQKYTPEYEQLLKDFGIL